MFLWGLVRVYVGSCRLGQIAAYITEQLRREGTLSFENLSDRAVRDLSSSFDGKVLWYLVTVKLDLEARQIIERIPRTSPHELRLLE